MPWSNLASNQMVSFTDAQTSGIVLKPGQSQVTSNQCMTKAEIIAKYYVTISGYSDNQLVPKSAWNGNVYSFGFTAGFATAPSACVLSFTRTRYSNATTPSFGSVIYTDVALTLPLNGGNSWYAADGTMYGGSYQISPAGIIINVYNCGY